MRVVLDPGTASPGFNSRAAFLSERTSICLDLVHEEREFDDSSSVESRNRVQHPHDTVEVPICYRRLRGYGLQNLAPVGVIDPADAVGGKKTLGGHCGRGGGVRDATAEWRRCVPRVRVREGPRNDKAPVIGCFERNSTENNVDRIVHPDLRHDENAG